jgi:hypothetical protein
VTSSEGSDDAEAGESGDEEAVESSDEESTSPASSLGLGDVKSSEEDVP